MAVDFSTAEAGEALEALSGAYAGRRRADAGRPAGCLLLDPDGFRACRLLASFEGRVRAGGGVVVSGVWREGLVRPFGGFLDVVDDLVARVLPRHPSLIRRYGRSLATLLPAWGEAEPLRKARAIRSGLADFVLHGDQGGLDEYYRKRNLAPQVIADLVHFTLDAAAAVSEETGAPTVLLFEDVHLAGTSAADALRLLCSYARGAPVLVCAAARELTEAQLTRLKGSSDAPQLWQALELSVVTGREHDAGPSLEERLTPEQLELIRTAAVLVLPFRLSCWLRLVPERLRAQAEGALEVFVNEGLVRRVAGARYAFSHAGPRESAYSGLSPERRRVLHRDALAAEASDPFAASHHAEAAGLPGEGRPYALQAAERAWGVSAYECAIALAGRAFAPADGRGDENRSLLMALLHYEAGRHEEAELFLRHALEEEGGEGVDRTTLRRLLGYNAIFGLGDFVRGKEILEGVLKDYEARRREKDAGYVRNAIAYALLRTRKFGEAMEMENLTLDLVRNSRQQDGFLFSLLQLNLARLHRTLGASDQALQLFRGGLETQNSDLSPYVLLIFHGSLAYVHIARADYAAAVGTYHHCLELLRDMDVENVNDQLLALLSRQSAPILSDRLTRGDQLLCALALNLASLYGKLGLSERAAAHAAGVRHYVSALGEGACRELEATLDGPADAPAPDGAGAAGEWAGGADNRFSHLVREVAGADELAGRVAESLGAGRAVALVLRREVGAGVSLVDSLVVYDPREAALAQSVSAEVGAAGSPSARSALLLPESVDLFSRGLEPLPLVFQEGTLKPVHRDHLKALLPYHLRVQVLSPEFDGLLFEILQAFARLTGVGVLAAVPFHLRGRDLAATPEKALGSFLISSLDLLVLGDRLLSKTHGAAAAENLVDFHPRLSQHASVIDESRPAGSDETFLIQVRTWSHPQYLRLRGEMRPVVELCDGRRSLAEVAQAARGQSPAAAQQKQHVYGFLRELWKRGAVCFDEPGRRQPADGNTSRLV